MSTFTKRGRVSSQRLSMYLPLSLRRGRFHCMCAFRFNNVLYVQLSSRNGYPLSWGSAPWKGCGYPFNARWYRGASDMALARRAEAVANKGMQVASAEAEFVQHFPTVWEYLTETTFTDGSKRLTSSLNIFFQDGVCKISIRDKEAGEILWASADGPMSALKVLEGMLVSGEAEWRKDAFAGGAKRKPGKKTPGHVGG